MSIRRHTDSNCNWGQPDGDRISTGHRPLCLVPRTSDLIYLFPPQFRSNQRTAFMQAVKSDRRSGALSPKQSQLCSSLNRLFRSGLKCSLTAGALIGNLAARGRGKYPRALSAGLWWGKTSPPAQFSAGQSGQGANRSKQSIHHRETLRCVRIDDPGSRKISPLPREWSLEDQETRST